MFTRSSGILRAFAGAAITTSLIVPLQALPVVTPSAWAAPARATVHFSRQPVERSVYSLGGTLRLAVQAESTDGSPLQYQWMWSSNTDHGNPQEVDPNGDSDTKPVLTTTLTSAAGTYYYWVKVTSSTQTVTSESSTVIVVDRTLEKQLMNGDFQEYGGQLDNPWQPGSWVYVPTAVKGNWNDATLRPDNGLSEHYANLGEYLPYWNTTHFMDWRYLKLIELQNPTSTSLNVSGAGLSAEGHADDARSDAEKQYTQHIPLIAELSGEAQSSIYQDIATVPGKVYEWSLDHASEYGAGSMNYPDTLAVIIGPSINAASDYSADVTNRWETTSLIGVTDGGAGSMVLAVPENVYPYGKDTASLFQDVLVKTANDQGMPGDTDNAKVKALKDHSGETYTTEYNGSKYYVAINTDPTSDPNWVQASGSYSVPRGQGTTVFGFVTLDSSKGQAGNLLDNIVFKSGSTPDSQQNVAYDGESTVQTKTTAGYAYALAELRGSAVYPLQERDAWFTPTDGSEAAATINADLGDGVSWYTPGEGKLVFKDLVPGKTYRLIGIPAEAVSQSLGTNVTPADVLDDGYYADTTIKAAKSDVTDDGIGPNVYVSLYADPQSSNRFLGEIKLAATDSRSEYALLANIGSDSAVSKPDWVPVAWDGTTLGKTDAATWAPGSSSIAFRGLTTGMEYRVIVRPAGYAELTWQTIAADTDNVVSIKIPSRSSVVTADDVERTLSIGRDTLKVKATSNTEYWVFDADTGEKLWAGTLGSPSSEPSVQGDGVTMFIYLGTAHLGKTLRLSTKSGDTFTQGVLVYPFPGYKETTQLKIDYVAESIGVGAGVVPAGLKFRVMYNGQPLTFGSQPSDAGYVVANGSSRIRLGSNNSYTSKPILDSVTSGSASLDYRFACPAEEDCVSPVSTFPIPGRPEAGSSEPSNVDWAAETIGDKTFADYGYNGLADLVIKVSEPAVAGVKFASKPVDFLIKKRPAAPTGLGAEFIDGSLMVSGLQDGVGYESSTDQVTWTPIADISDGKADLGLGSAFYVRFAPNPAAHAPASLPAKASDHPIALENVSFDAVKLGYEVPDSLPVIIENKTINSVDTTGKSAIVVISNQTKDGQPYADGAFEIDGSTSGQLPTLAPNSSAESGFEVTVKPGLPVGSYRALLNMNYFTSGPGSAQAELSFVVEKADWPATDFAKTFSVEGNVIKVELTNEVPQGATPEFSLDQDNWQTSGTFSDLEWSTNYEVWVRLPGDEGHNAAEPVLLIPSLYTNQPTPVLSSVLRVNYSAETIEFQPGHRPDDYRLTLNGNPAGANASLSALADAGSIPISLVRKGQGDPTAGPGDSSAASQVINGRPAAPSSGDISTTPAETQNRPTGTITDSTGSAFEYRVSGGSGAWTSARTGTATEVAYGTYDVRYPATSSTFASAALNGVQVGALKIEYQVIWNSTIQGDAQNVSVTAEVVGVGPIQPGEMVAENATVKFTAKVDSLEGWFRFAWDDGSEGLTDSRDWDPIASVIQDTWEIPVTCNLHVTAQIGAWYKRSVGYDAHLGNGTVAATANTLSRPEYTVTLSDGTGLSREGYVFAGWDTNPNARSAAFAPGAQFSMTNGYSGPGQDVTLYAIWASKEAQLLTVFGKAVSPTGGDGSEGNPYLVSASVAAGQAKLTASDVTLSDGATTDVDAELASGGTTDVDVVVRAAASNASHYRVSVWRPAAVAEIEGVVDLVDEFIKQGVLDGFSAESVEDLKQALADAKKAAADPNATQAQVDAARQALLDAVQNLKPKDGGPADAAEVSALRKLVAKAKEAKADNYTAASYNTLKKKLAAAQEALAENPPKANTVNKARAELLAALAGLRAHYTTAVRVQVKSVNVAVKKTFQLGGLAYLTSGKTQTPKYATSNKAVATVDATGKVRGVKAGTAVITATSPKPGASGKALSVKVTVKVVKSAAAVKSLSASVPAHVPAGDVRQVLPKLGNATPATVTYSSSNSKVLKIDKAGQLTAVAKGTAKITVKAGGKSKTYTVKVGLLTKVQPRIGGQRIVGKTLTALPGKWGPGQVKFRYQWYRDGKAISKATGKTYKLVQADKGKKITVKVTGSKSGYATASSTSKKTVKIK